MDAPTKEHLHMMFTMHATQLMVLAGLSVTSDHDQFVKKTGRHIAEQRISPIVANLLGVSFVGTKHIYDFRIDNYKVGYKTYSVNFSLSTVAESDGVNLFSAIILAK
jgi:hypothetical protein